ncbi:MAG: AAA family ATPase, partial [Chloroflexota bacterium]
MTKIITWANNKGGSAKTTTTTIVAHGLTMMLEKATDNNKILVVDTDSQAHSTLLLCGHANFADEASLIGVLNAQRENSNSAEQIRNKIVESNWHPNLHILPVAEGLGLDNVEAGLNGYDGNVFYLERILQKIKKDYALIFIDTSPKFSLLTKQAQQESLPHHLQVMPS